MKMKIIIKIILCILLVVIFPTIIFFVSNFIFPHNFIFSNIINNNLSNIFKNNNLLSFKKADYLYKMWDFDRALKKYTEIDCNNRNDCFILNHNIWNTYFKSWENLNNLDKLDSWQKSLLYYFKALNINPNLETKKNYDFVFDRLNKLKQEMKKEQSKEKKQEKPEEKNDNKKQEKQNKESPKEETIIPKLPSMQISNNQEKAQIQLTKEEKIEIKKYLETLQEEEKQNIEFNKPQLYEDIYDILEKDFFSWFWENEKDW